MKSVVLLIAWLAATPAFADQNVTIQGKSFYLDGRPWLPKGVTVEGFNRPAVIPSAPKWMNDPSNLRGRQWWASGEAQVIRTAFAATVVRFNVSQPALDPRAQIYDPTYRDELLRTFSEARAAGLVVIVSMDAQAESGQTGLPCMPDDSTVRAWRTLAPPLLENPGVMLELFNEPCRAMGEPGRAAWAQGTQKVIDALRSMGARNVLLLDGLGFGQWTTGLFLLVHDRLRGRMAMAVHPYFDPLAKEPATTPDAYFAAHFGQDADRYPILATEWNATETNGCAGERTPAIAQALVRYLQARRVGLIGWGIDSRYGKLVKDHDRYTPTDYADFRGCLDKRKTTGPSGGGQLLARFPNN